MKVNPTPVAAAGLLGYGLELLVIAAAMGAAKGRGTCAPSSTYNSSASSERYYFEVYELDPETGIPSGLPVARSGWFSADVPALIPTAGSSLQPATSALGVEVIEDDGRYITYDYIVETGGQWATTPDNQTQAGRPECDLIPNYCVVINRVKEVGQVDLTPKSFQPVGGASQKYYQLSVGPQGAFESRDYQQMSVSVPTLEGQVMWAQGSEIEDFGARIVGKNVLDDGTSQFELEVWERDEEGQPVVTERRIVASGDTEFCGFSEDGEAYCLVVSSWDVWPTGGE